MGTKVFVTNAVTTEDLERPLLSDEGRPQLLGIFTSPNQARAAGRAEVVRQLTEDHRWDQERLKRCVWVSWTPEGESGGVAGQPSDRVVLTTPEKGKPYYSEQFRMFNGRSWSDVACLVIQQMEVEEPKR